MRVCLFETGLSPVRTERVAQCFLSSKNSRPNRPNSFGRVQLCPRQHNFWHLTTRSPILLGVLYFVCYVSFFIFICQCALYDLCDLFLQPNVVETSCPLWHNRCIRILTKLGCCAVGEYSRHFFGIRKCFLHPSRCWVLFGMCRRPSTVSDSKDGAPYMGHHAIFCSHCTTCGRDLKRRILD